MDLNVVLRTSLLLAAACVAARLLRRAAPSTRHLLWHAAIVMVLLAPALAPLAPKFNVPMVRTVPRVPRGLVPMVTMVPGASAPGTSGTSTPGTTPLGTRGTVRTTGTLAALAVGVWFAFGWLCSGLSVRRSKPAPTAWIYDARQVCARIGLPEIEIRQSLREGSPHVAGLFRSIVMIPAQAAAWTADARYATLVHELTHIRRRDRRTQAIAQLACAVYWFNPLVWHAAGSLARERERACDDEVLRMGAKPSDYAALLLDLARRPGPWLPATALAMARRSAIEGRLLLILGHVVRTPRRSSRWLVTAGIAAIATAILGAQPAAPPRAEGTPKMPDLMDADRDAMLPSLTGAFVKALGDTSRQVREKAALGLALTPGDDVIDPLLTALKDPDAQVREKAAIGLAFRRDPRIVEPLLAAIADEDAQVREKAAIALGASGDARALDALRKAATDPDSQVREKAVAGLLLFGLRQ